MKYFFFLIILMQLFFLQAHSAEADVVLNIPDDVRIVAVNGYNAESAESTTLPNGLNQVAVYFTDEISQPFDEPEVERSDVFILLFSVENTTLTLQKEITKNRSQLEKFNLKPKFLLLKQSGEAVSFEIDKLVKEGFMLARDYQQELVAFNMSQSSAAMRQRFQSTRIDSLPIEENRIQQINVTPNSSMAEQMLKYWYQQADEGTRNRFRAWLEEI